MVWNRLNGRSNPLCNTLQGGTNIVPDSPRVARLVISLVRQNKTPDIEVIELGIAENPCWIFIFKKPNGIRRKSVSIRIDVTRSNALTHRRLANFGDGRDSGEAPVVFRQRKSL